MFLEGPRKRRALGARGFLAILFHWKRIICSFRFVVVLVFGPVEFSHGSPALTCLRQPLTPPPSCLLGRFALGKCADENQVTESV